MIKRAWNSPQVVAPRLFQEKFITSILKGFFKPRLFLFLSVLLLPSTSAFCLENASEIVKVLDAHYYYPQKQGLKKLSVRMEWEQLDVINDSGIYLKNPPIEFLWEKSPAGSKSVFKLGDGSIEVSEDRRKELLGMLENYKEVVIPKTLEEKMAGYKGQIKNAKKQSRLVEFDSLNAGAGIKKYSLMVDLAQKNVRKIRIERKTAPFNIVSDVRYTRKEDKWLIAESRTNFRVGEMEYRETTEYVYRRAGKFWLVGKMSQTLNMDDRILQSFIFRFSDYKFN